MTEKRMERISLIWAYGIRDMLEHYAYDEVVEECMHSLPDGRRLSTPTMSRDEAEKMIKTGSFPDRFFFKTQEK